MTNNKEASEWMKSISYLPQQHFFFSDSLIKNITLSNGDNVDWDRIHTICEKVSLVTLVNSFDQKFEEHLGEGATLVSGGQRQRIGLARALYKKADIYIFDEPTSELDEKTADKVFDGIRSLTTDAILIVISHNQKIIDRCDKVLNLIKQ